MDTKCPVSAIPCMRKIQVGMIIKVNGQEQDTKSSTITELLEELEIECERVAVELNLKVISKKDFGLAEIRPGDAIEIVNFVGGG